MIVCHCKRVGDRTVENAIAAGAMTREELTQSCRAGGGCGTCWPALEAMLSSSVGSREPASIAA